MAKELERVKRERDDERSEREYQECLVKERDATISLMEESCSDCVVRRERDAAYADLRRHSTCSTCANAPEHYSKICCHTCALENDFMGYKWRGPCAENGGTEDGV